MNLSEGGEFQIYRKEKSPWDFVEVKLLFPTSRFLKDEDNEEKRSGFFVKLNTGILYDRDYDGYTFIFFVLGFGFRILRQWSY
jgi:hypothetical protein